MSKAEGKIWLRLSVMDTATEIKDNGRYLVDYLVIEATEHQIDWWLSKARVLASRGGSQPYAELWLLTGFTIWTRDPEEIIEKLPWRKWPRPSVKGNKSIAWLPACLPLAHYVALLDKRVEFPETGREMIEVETNEITFLTRHRSAFVCYRSATITVRELDLMLTAIRGEESFTTV